MSDQPTPVPGQEQQTEPNPVPAPAPTQQATDWESRYKGVLPTLQQQAERIKTLESELNAFRSTAEASTGQVQQLQQTLQAEQQAKQTLEAQMQELQATVERLQLFSQFPQLVPFADKIELKGTIEEKRATLEALAKTITTQAEAQAQSAIQQALANTTPSVNPTGQSTPEQEIAQLEDQAWQAMLAGEHDKADQLLTRKFELEAQLAQGWNGPRRLHPSMFHQRPTSD